MIKQLHHKSEQKEPLMRRQIVLPHYFRKYEHEAIKFFSTDTEIIFSKFIKDTKGLTRLMKMKKSGTRK